MKTYAKGNFTVIETENAEAGAKSAFRLLTRLVDNKTLLFLSGGETPGQLYRLIAKDADYNLNPAAVATVDERWGPPGHPASNEEMIRKTGLYRHFDPTDTEIHTILHGILNKTETARRYETVLQGLLERIWDTAAIMGIGADGHTAGLVPDSERWKDPKRMVADFSVGKEEIKNSARITLTPAAIALVDKHIILAFGDRKRKILNNLISTEESEADYPAQLYKNLKKELYLITDQRLA